MRMPFGTRAPSDGKALRVLEEVDDLLELGGGLVDARDVFPAHGGLRVRLDLRRLHPRHEREHPPEEVDDQAEEDQGQPGEQLVLAGDSESRRSASTPTLIGREGAKP